MKQSEDPAKLFQMGEWAGSYHWEPPEPSSISITGVQIESLVGRGGSGAVYRGIQVSLDRTVAVKILPAEVLRQPLARERFRQEAKILASLKHPHIINIFDFGEMLDGAPYIVMEWAHGGDLAQQLKQGPLSTEVVYGWITEIIRGLEFAHGQGIIHRDLKPGNILIDDEGQIKLGDFGLAQAPRSISSSGLTMSGMTMGTISYMAPEQLKADGEISPRTDIYALGVLSYELLTGQLPRGAFPRASTISKAPAGIDTVIAQALSPNPAKRYASVSDFYAAFARAFRRRYHQRILLLAMIAIGISVVALYSFDVRSTPSTVSDSSQIAAPKQSVVFPTTRDSTGADGVQEAKWTDLIPLIDPKRDGRSGQWALHENEIVSNNERAILRLPVRVGENYDIRVRFTRLSGIHSVAFFLPTESGPLTFELDAWERNLGGIQDIDGKDMRALGPTFFAPLVNGQQESVRIEVRTDRLRCYWDERPVIDQPLDQRKFSVNPLWETDTPALPGIGSWKSPTAFHSIEIRQLN